MIILRNVKLWVLFYVVELFMEVKVPALIDTLRDLLDFHCWRFEVGWKQNCWSV